MASASASLTAPQSTELIGEKEDIMQSKMPVGTVSNVPEHEATNGSVTSENSSERDIHPHQTNGSHRANEATGISGTNLIINYLPQHMTQDEVRALFSSLGDIESCKLIRDKVTGQSLGYAFVNYARSEDAQRALSSLNGLRLQNKTIKVSLARPSNEAIKGANLYVSGLPKTLTQKEMEALFRPYGCIVTSRILNDNITGLSKGVGFVRLDTRAEAEEAIKKLNGTTPFGVNSEPIQVKFANSPTSVAQKTVMQIANAAASNLLPMTMLQAVSPPVIGQQTITIPRISSLVAAAAAAGGGGGGGPIHHPTQLSRFRYSPLAGVPNYAHVTPLTQASVPSQGLADASAPWYNNGCNTTVGATAPAATTALLLHQLAALAASTTQTPSLSPALPINPSQLLTALAFGHSPAIGGIGGALPGASSLTTILGGAVTPAVAYTLHVQNLPVEADEATLWRLFSSFGAVTSVKLPKDSTTNTCKGHAYVSMSSWEEGLTAVQSLNGAQLGNRTLQVSLRPDLLPAC